MRRVLVALVGMLAVGAAIYFVGRRPEMMAARAIQCGLATVLLALLAWASTGGLRNALVILCSLVFGLTALETAALAMRPTPGPAGAVEIDTGASGGRPLIGWGPLKPGVYRAAKIEPDGHAIYDAKVTIDDDLNRKTVSAEEARPIVFFGDSWMFGAGLNDDGTIPQAFADLTGHKIPVLNLSYSGWSPAVNLIALQSGLYKPLLRQPRHFILFAAMFHVERIACRAGYRFSGAPHFVVDGDAVRYAGQCSEIGGKLMQPLVNFARRFVLYERIAPYFAEPVRADVETFIKIVETFVKTAKRDYGVETTVLMPEKGDPYIRRTGYTEAQVVDKLRKAGIDVLLDVLPKIADESLYWIPGDLHPTALANKARARAIEAHLAKVDPDALKVAGGDHP